MRLIRNTGDTFLRIVIQHIVVQPKKEGHGGLFRLVAYDEHRTCRPRDFDSLSQLVQTVRAAVPGFSESDLHLNGCSDMTRIVYTGEWELSKAQLTLLGLQ